MKPIADICTAVFRGKNVGMEKAYIRSIPLKGIELKQYLN